MTNNNADDLKVYQQVISQPKVPITLRIGIVGSRDLTTEQCQKGLMALQRVVDQLVTILGDYRTPTSSHFDIADTLYDLSQTCIVRLTSSLAAGADRIGMHSDSISGFGSDHIENDHVVLERAAIIPFSRHDYAIDFHSSISATSSGKLDEKEEFEKLLNSIENQVSPHLIELDGDYSDSDTRDRAYARCTSLLIENCDLLISIADPTKISVAPKGHVAGTQGSVDTAISRQTPVIQIDPMGNRPVAIIQSQRFGRSEALEEFGQHSCRTMLNRIVLFSSIFEYEGANFDANVAVEQRLSERRQSILHSAQEYFNDQKHLKYVPDRYPDFNYQGPIEAPFSTKGRWCGFGSFDWFKTCLINPIRVRNFSQSLSKSNIECQNVDKLNNSDLPHNIYAHFLRADALGVYYASIHRSTYFLIYVFAGVALMSAAVSAVFKSYLVLLIMMIGTKVAALVAIYGLYRFDHHNHHRWLQARCLAESIRPNIYLTLLGRCFSFFDKRSTDEFKFREILGHTNNGGQWVCMHAEAINRYEGFKRVMLNVQDHKQSALCFLQNKWIAGQISYHRSNASTMKCIGLNLSRITKVLFFSTVAVVGVKIALLVAFAGGKIPDYSIWAVPSKLITLLTMLLPIAGTVFYAIRNHAEFDISAQRSLTMHAFFSGVNQLIASKMNLPSRQVDEDINKLASMSAQEIADWLEIYEVKESEPG